MATGAISAIACAFHAGAVKRGKPIHGAAATAAKSIGLPSPRPLVQSA